MNERIHVLAEQARQYATTRHPVSNIVLACDSYVFEQKFAELIVEEFRNVLSDEYRKTPLECCGHFLRADEAIAEHFYGDM